MFKEDSNDDEKLTKCIFHIENKINGNLRNCTNNHSNPKVRFLLKKLRHIKGDSQVEEFDDELIIPSEGNIADNVKVPEDNVIKDGDNNKKLKLKVSGASTSNNFARKGSSVFEGLSRENLKLFRERELTPEVKASRKINEEEEEEDTDNNNNNNELDTDLKISKKFIHHHNKHFLSVKQESKELTTNDSLNIISRKSKKSITGHSSFKHSQTGFFHITTESKSTIKLPKDFLTDDYDLKHLCDLINESKDNGWREVFIQSNMSIYRKSSKNSPFVMIKTYADIEGYTKEEVFRAIADVNIRKEWDKIFSEFKVIESEELRGKEFLYMSIKSPSIFVSDRDFVQQRKIWKNVPDEKSVIIHFKSVEHPLAPERHKIVRANTLISGYYIETISVNPPKTFLSIISQTDIGGNIPKWIVNTVSQKAPKDWILNLSKGCQMAKQLHK